jgi:hypothetical protein
MATATCQVGKRLAAGALMGLVGAGVGAGVGYFAAAMLLLSLFYCLSRGSAGHWSPTLVMFLMRNTAVVVYGGISLGGVGGVFLGVWLIRRLFTARPSAREVT